MHFKDKKNILHAEHFCKIFLKILPKALFVLAKTAFT
jgi:hypothetical protein